jgi:hypothetical protein
MGNHWDLLRCVCQYWSMGFLAPGERGCCLLEDTNFFLSQNGLEASMIPLAEICSPSLYFSVYCCCYIAWTSLSALQAALLILLSHKQWKWDRCLKALHKCICLIRLAFCKYTPLDPVISWRKCCPKTWFKNDIGNISNFYVYWFSHCGTGHL